MSKISLPLCECGCGELVSKEGNRFVFGHHYRIRFPLCECGCGQHVTRHFNRFISGHNWRSVCRSKKPSEEPKLCECGCGRLAKAGNRFITGHNARLTRGPRKPFSEEHKQKLSIAMKERWADSRYRLVMSKRFQGEDNPNFGGKAHTEEIRQKMSDIRKQYLKENEHPRGFLGYHHTEDAKQRMSEALSGENHPNWQGGISPYGSEFNNGLKAEIRKRDGFRCQKCGRTEQEELNKVLSVHHIDYDKENNDQDNLITLCAACNTIVNYNRPYWQSFFSESHLEQPI